MVMDTRLPLMAKAPDPLGSYSRGISAADLFNRTKREQGKQNFLKQYGEALFSGDQSALSAYAAHDLQGAKQIQAQQQAEAARRAAAGRAAGRARAQEAQGRLQGGLDASSVIYGQAMDLPEGEREAFFNEKMIEVVGPDFLGQTGITVDTFPSRAAMFSAEQGLKHKPYEAPKGDYKVVGSELVDLGAEGGPAPVEGIGGATFRPTTQEEVTQYGQPGQIDDETGRFYPIKLPDGMTIKVSPEGSIEVVQGAGVGAEDTPRTADKVPAGYEEFTDLAGNIAQRPIRGGKVWTGIVADSKRSHRALENYIANSENVESKIDRAIEIINSAGVPVTGLIGWAAKGFPGTPAYELNTLIGEEGTITTNESFDLLRQLKSESKTGGAVGQLSDPERRAMGAIHENLKQGNNKQAVLNSLTNLKEFRIDSRGRIVDAYAEDFADIAAIYGAPTGLLTVDQIATVPYDEIMSTNAATIQYMTREQVSALNDRIAAGE